MKQETITTNSIDYALEACVLIGMFEQLLTGDGDLLYTYKENKDYFYDSEEIRTIFYNINEIKDGDLKQKVISRFKETLGYHSELLVNYVNNLMME